MTPSISFVVAGRNDNYGGDFLQRMQTFINLLSHQLDANGADGELVVVEWNPPADRPLLKDVLAWPEGMKARVFVVGEEMHEMFRNPNKVPIFDHIARNVGIRRARGQYVLATNPDVIYNTKLAEFLVSERLERGCYYRVDRYDVTTALPATSDAREILAFCASHFSKVDLRGGSVGVPFGTSGKMGQLGWEIERWLHELLSRILRPFRLEDMMYTNAAGAFVLMNRDHWFDLRGFPEVPIVTQYDAYVVAEAYSMGLRLVQLPSSLRMYHLDHGRSWPASPGAKDIYEQWVRDARKMLSSKKPEMVNGENWGLGGLDLTEYSYGPH